MKPSLHLIDGAGNLTTDLPDYIKSTHLANGYGVVAVLGAQSSGKSTLLNTLFGTQFQTMDATQGRSQTTKGIWMAVHNEHVVILDVEGTDSKERAEEGFERKSSLFSLAIAEVLLVNLWYTDIGRYNASNYALLKTVFEVNLQLFARKNSPKTVLLFVIRDHVDSSLEVLEKNLVTDMSTIWESLTKPDEFATSRVTDFFDFAFVSFPHYVYKKDEFMATATDLRKRFTDPKHSGYLFAPKNSKAVPPDGLTHYIGSIWTAIKENKDLDLPSQKEMLAKFRCDEISAEITEKFNESIRSIRASVDKGLSANSASATAPIGEQFTKLLGDAIASYDTQSHTYHQGVAQQRRKELIDALDAELLSIYRAILSALRIGISGSFRNSVSSTIPRTPGVAARDFNDKISRLTKDACDTFQKAAAAAIPALEETQWTFDAPLSELTESCKDIAHMERKSQLEILHHELEARVTDLTAEDLAGLLEAAKPTMWQSIQEHYNEVHAKLIEEFMSVFDGFAPSATEKEAFLGFLDKALITVVRKTCTSFASQLVTKLKGLFDRRFKLDEQGVPRVWAPTEDIRAVFIKAKEDTLPLIDLYAEIKLKPKVAVLEKKLLSESKKEEIIAAFQREIETSYVDAKRAQEANNRPSNIPLWVYIALIILGWNEFYSLITSPLLLAVMIGGVFLLMSGFAESLNIPVLNFAAGMLREKLVDMHKTFESQLNQAGAAGGAAAPAAAPAPAAAHAAPAGTAASGSNSTDAHDKEKQARKRSVPSSKAD